MDASHRTSVPVHLSNAITRMKDGSTSDSLDHCEVREIRGAGKYVRRKVDQQGTSQREGRVAPSRPWRSCNCKVRAKLSAAIRNDHL
jgi:hypothetical protein